MINDKETILTHSIITITHNIIPIIITSTDDKQSMTCAYNILLYHYIITIVVHYNLLSFSHCIHSNNDQFRIEWNAKLSLTTNQTNKNKLHRHRWLMFYRFGPFSILFNRRVSSSLYIFCSVFIFSNNCSRLK